MDKPPSIYSFIGKLKDVNTRARIAKELASALGSENLIFFIEDEVVGSILPSSGFEQTLYNGARWQELLWKAKERNSVFSDIEISAGIKSIVSIYSDREGGFIAFFGPPPSQELLEPILEVLPLITTLFKKELAYMSDSALVSTAHREAEKAERLSTGLDIARKKLKDALIKEEKAAEKLRVLMDQKDEFMNIVSHELKTPLTSMKGYLELTQNLIALNKLDSVKGYIEKAHRQADKLNSLVSDLLDVTKINAGKLVFNFQPFKVEDLIQDCVEQNQNISNHQIYVQGNLDLTVTGDRNRLEQVICNLLTNAIKYSPGKERVDLKVTEENNYILIEISDTGIGIAEENQAYVFDRFFRSEKVESKFFGLGLGLFISSEIIKRHQGEIGVKSKLGQGSTFWFRIPK